MVEKLSRHIALWLKKPVIFENDEINLYKYAKQYLLLILIRQLFSQRIV